MADQRGRGPGGSRGPDGRTPRGSAPRVRPSGCTGPAATGSQTAIAVVAPGSTSSPKSATSSGRSRFTGRAAVLVLVVAVLTVSYGSSLKAYLQQRSQIADLKVQIEQKRSNIDVLEREKRRWDDPAFLEAQARDRFGWVKPGQTSYVVLDADGQPLRSTAVLSDPDAVVRESPTAWYDTAWASIQLAGNPPAERKQGRPPATEIDGTHE